ncbi:MAG: tetratricopeptide repeat protein, partial [bacterium]|nr:tetratricopeptide repeat protein [bacterium]
EQQPERAVLYHNLGQLYQDNGQWREAEKLYREAIARDPADPQSWSNLGYLLLQQERWAEAASTLQQMLQNAPGQVDGYINLASAHLNLGQAAQAAAAYEQFLQRYDTEDDTRRKVQRQLQLLQQNPD